METQKVVAKYTFDLKTNALTTTSEDNPTAGTIHRFRAYRLKSAPPTEIKMAQQPGIPTSRDNAVEEDTEEC